MKFAGIAWVLCALFVLGCVSTPPSNSPTPSFVVSALPTPTSTPQASPTETPTPASSMTPTPTVTATPAPEATASPTASGFPSLPPAPSSTATPTPSGSVSGQNACQTDSDCVVDGCSGQVCRSKGSPPQYTTCEWRPEYACYTSDGCVCQAGQCAWTQEIQQCVQGFGGGS